MTDPTPSWASCRHGACGRWRRCMFMPCENPVLPGAEVETSAQSDSPERDADIELVREALTLAGIYAPADTDNDNICLVQDAKEAFERIVRNG